MAQVDFSNAVLDVNTNSASKQISLGTYLGLGDTGYPALYNSTGGDVSTNHSKTILSNTPSKVSILYTGAFSTSGTEFYIVHDGTSYRDWKVSNISFSPNDTYSFVIDIEVSGNT